jgi:acetyl-CoA carboxylase biotin carboxyl carrier protein
MSELKVTIDEIKSLMDQMAKTGLGKFELEDGDFKLSLASKKEQVVVASAPAEAVQVLSGTAENAAVAAAPAASEAETSVTGNEVTAPIVGTFYASPSPDKDAFVKVGDTVKKGDVLFIIESMKLMNEIQSEFDGEVVDICVENGTPVEFGQKIMVIR